MKVRVGVGWWEREPPPAGGHRSRAHAGDITSYRLRSASLKNRPRAHRG